MKIVEGNLRKLKKAKGWKKAKVTRKVNHWTHCPRCVSMHYFFIFKCRWDLSYLPRCACGTLTVPLTAEQLQQVAAVLPPSKLETRKGRVSGYPSAWHFWYFETYLKSDHWQEIKRRVLARDGGRCRVCVAPAAVVHHTKYKREVMAGNDDSALVSLCDRCHQEAHPNKQARSRAAAAV